MAPVTSTTSTPGVVEYELVTRNDELGWLRVSYTPSPAGDDTGPNSRRERPMEITARIGLLGSPDRERTLIEAVKRALRELAKQD